MKTKKKEKQFDSVKIMRTIRDEISAETKDMDFETLKKYIQSHIKKSKLKSEIS